MITNTNEQFTKNQLLSELLIAFNEVENFIQPLSSAVFHQRPNEKWSIGENLDHLVMSAIPVASALKRSKLMLRMLGKPKKPSRTYGELLANYKKILAKGFNAPSNYTPDTEKPKSKEMLLTSWGIVKRRFQERISDKWSEKDLEKYGLPHPALGFLTVREMLYFVIFHAYHHLEIMKERSIKKKMKEREEVTE